MRTRRLIAYFIFVVALTSGTLRSQNRPLPGSTAELRLHIGLSQPGKLHAVPAVAWLEPLAGTPAMPFVSHEPYTLLQKNRTFLPHLQVVPVGAVVQFPNADPFFHNVFSLYDGKRFDLGLYEAGSSKSVTFSREGVSYIFCNIHPEMSAVVLALPTPLFAIVDSNDSFVLRNIPPGDYKLHLWIEGVPQSVVDGLSRFVHLSTGTVDLGPLIIPTKPNGAAVHTNKFGNEYDPHPKSPYDH
jgi:plastocyanin